MNESLVVQSDEGAIRILRLNRPAARNALSRGLVNALVDALEQAGADATARVVVLTAEGPVFCAGMDLKEAQIGDTFESEQRAVGDTQGLADLFDRLHGLPKPVIAAVNGDAYGGGAGLVMAADLAAIAPSAKLGTPEVRRGLVASIIMHDLIRHVGDRRTRELLLLGEPIDAPTALAWGLVNRVATDPLAEAKAMAGALLAGGPQALQMTKRLIDEASARPPDLRGAAAITAMIRTSDEAREGMQAFAERRPPRWQAFGTEG